MRKLTYFVMALALVLGFTQCKKEQIEPQGGKVNITLNVENGASTGSATDGSKVNVNPNSSPMVTFGNGDRILVAYDGKYVGYLEHNGSNFSGEISASGDNTKPLYFYFLGNCVDVSGLTAGTTTSCTANISDQTAYPALPVISFSASDQNFNGAGSYTASLHNKASLMKFNVTTPSNSPICITGMNNKVIIDFSKAANDGENNGFTYDKDGDGIIKLKGGSGSPATKWAIVLPQDALSAGEAFSEDYYIGTRPALSAISINQYLDSGVSMTVNSKWDGDLSSLSGSLSEIYTTATDGMIITGTFQKYYQPYKISIAAGATVTLDGVDINSSGHPSGDYAGLTCLGDATIILSGTNTVKGFATKYPGIHVPSGNTLTIQGTGTLNASSNGYSYAAGIGGGNMIPCGNITINSGTITATCGGSSSAGIGGGDKSSCGDITIYGGTVTATGGQYGAGIGCGNNAASSCGAITIYGGNVIATGGDYAAGIGSGDGSSCGAITISGGTVTATGTGYGAGIGSGYPSKSSCGAITIQNTVTRVTATKGSSATNSIGKGYNYSTCGTVTIGGVVGAISTSPYTYEP